MWVMTRSAALLSIVAYEGNDAYLMVRARRRVDLERLVKLARGDIIETPDHDYPYRIVISRKRFMTWMNVEVAGLDYTSHVKDVIIEQTDPADQPRMRTALYGVWQAMNGIDDRRRSEPTPEVFGDLDAEAWDAWLDDPEPWAPEDEVRR